jgi:hypothetical protein
MFYSDFGVHAYKTKVSHYMLTFARHFDQYENSRLIRSVDYGQIPWC